MRAAYKVRRTGLRVWSPLAARALFLLLIPFPAMGQQAVSPSKATVQAKPANLQAAGAQSKTTDAAKPAAQGKAPDAGKSAAQSSNNMAAMQMPRVVVPDVRGRTPSAAKEILESAGLRYGTTQQNSGPGTPGTVWRQNPAQQSVVTRGSVVNVDVVVAARPPQPDQHDNEFSRAVPWLIGRTPAQAQMLLARAGLNLGNQAAGAGSGSAGTIYAQSPQAGQWVKVSSRVDVQIVQASQSPKASKTPDTPQVIVPQLRGLTPQAAQQVLGKSNLQVGGSRTGQASAAAGTIYDQRPQAGAKVRAGSSVDLLVAAEKPTTKPVLVPVPDVRQRDAKTAATILQHSRLGLGQQTQQESESNPGLIASQSPQPGTRVEAGSRVDIVVAVEIPRVTVPNLVRLDEGAAATDLRENQLRLGSLAQGDSDEVSGTVIAQNPAAGTRVPRDSSVNLTVSRQIQRTLTVMVDNPSPEAEKSVRFHAHLDRDTAGFQYSFEYGDGKQSGLTNVPIVSHAYESPGAYVVTATATRGNVKVPSASVGVTAREIEFRPTLTATPQKAKRGDLVAFKVKSDRADIRPYYQIEFADGKQSDWSEELVTQHLYDHGGTYVTRVRGRVRNGRIVEGAVQVVEVEMFSTLQLILLGAGLAGAGVGALIYHGWKQFLKLVRAVPRMDAGKQQLEIPGAASSGEGARLRMIWPRGEQVVEWSPGREPRKAEGHD
jgi:beta-lactam-binding protein with PASTA domain